MAYRILYKRSVENDLKRLPVNEAKRILERIEEELEKHPDALPTLKGRFSDMRKMRVGDYRVIYMVLGEDVIILRVSHRKDAYK